MAPEARMLAVGLTALGWDTRCSAPPFPWLRHDSVKGVALVYAGVLACSFR